jgi:hypothetical protein
MFTDIAPDHLHGRLQKRSSVKMSDTVQCGKREYVKDEIVWGKTRECRKGVSEMKRAAAAFATTALIFQV